MESVGVYEAKTHLAQLLERVAKGERIAITKHGVAIATLQPVGPANVRPAKEIIAELKRLGKARRLGRRALRQMIEQGRR